jgi:hypothetical protein
VAAQRLRRLRQVELEGLANGDKAVKEGAWKPHVVVDGEHPIRGALVDGCQDLVQVLELPAAEPLGDGLRAQRRLGFAGRAERDAHVVGL